MRVIAGWFCLCLAVAVATVHYKETFDGDWEDRWIVSDAKKSSGEAGKWRVSAGDFPGDADADKGLQTTQDARFYFTTSKLKKPFSNEGKDLVIQFSVKHQQKIDCGGGYIKLLPSNVDQAHFNGDSPYLIMFGPDICGSSTKKVHVIFNYKSENKLIKKTIACKDDQLTHVYTLIVHPDNTYEVRIDGSKVESGNLEDDWDFLEPKMIKDPSQKKPSDWVDDAQIDDPNDTKPANWDDVPKTIPDPEAEKPDDWDDEEDGEWEAPTLPNPEWKGEWKPKKIPNPAYKGKWVHPEIENPAYVEDKTLYRYQDIGAVGFDLWQVKSGTIFDNILVTDSVAEAEALLADTWSKNKAAEKAAFDAFEKKEQDKQAEERKKVEEANKADDEDEDEDDGEQKFKEDL